jgi:hypothetical protein
MHLAALSPAAPALSRLLASLCAPGPAAWFLAAADDGLTPANFCERLGRPELNADMLQHAIAAGAPPLPPPLPPAARACFPAHALHGLACRSFSPLNLPAPLSASAPPAPHRAMRQAPRLAQSLCRLLLWPYPQPRPVLQAGPPIALRARPPRRPGPRAGGGRARGAVPARRRAGRHHAQSDPALRAVPLRRAGARRAGRCVRRAGPQPRALRPGRPAGLAGVQRRRWRAALQVEHACARGRRRVVLCAVPQALAASSAAFYCRRW